MCDFFTELKNSDLCDMVNPLIDVEDNLTTVKVHRVGLGKIHSTYYMYKSPILFVSVSWVPK